MKKMINLNVKQWFALKNFDRELTDNPNTYFTIESETEKAVELKIFKPEYPNYPAFKKWIPKSIIENLDWVLGTDGEEDLEVKTAKYNNRIASAINMIAMREAKIAEKRYAGGASVFTPEYYGGEWPEEVEKLYLSMNRENANENAKKIQKIFEELATTYAKALAKKNWEELMRKKGEQNNA